MARLAKLVTTDGELEVNDRVQVNTTHEPGVVLFKGKTDFSEGEWVGVALDKPVGKNDGTVKGKKYFECPPGHGIFVRKAALIRVKQAQAAMTKKPSEKNGAEKLMKGLKTSKDKKNISSKADSKAKAAPASSPKSAPASPATASSPKSAPVSPSTGSKAKSASSQGFAMEEEQKAAALTELRIAVEERDVARIQRALGMAAAESVTGPEVESAQHVLKFENQRTLSNEIGKIRSCVATLAKTVAKTQERTSAVEKLVKSDSSSSQALGSWVTGVVQIVEQRLWAALERCVDAKIDSAVKQVTGELMRSGVEPTKLKVTGQVDRENLAASKIQSRVRGKQARETKGKQGAAATKLQAAWRGKAARAKLDTCSISSAVQLARRRYEAWSSIYDKACAGKPGLDAATFHGALTLVHPKYTPGQTSAIFKGYCRGTGRGTLDLPGFCGIAEGCAISDKMAAEFADVNLEIFSSLGKPGAAEAATKVQALQRGKAERAHMAKRTEAAKSIQRHVRNQQANAKASGGSGMFSVVKTARRRFAAWAGVFDESRGTAEALTDTAFVSAVGQVHANMPLGQINALYKGYCKGTGKSCIDLRGFCGIMEAVSMGSEQAAEFADISLEAYEMLGAAGSDGAAIKLQALVRGRQAREEIVGSLRIFFAHSNADLKKCCFDSWRGRQASGEIIDQPS